MHPFTIANVSGDEHLNLLIKAHSGFSKRLRKAALKSNTQAKPFLGFLSGPWGLPPDLRHYETIVLIACSSGATFAVPILRELLSGQSCVRNIHVHWIIRSQSHYDWFKRDLTSLYDGDIASSTSLHITIHVNAERHEAVMDVNAPSEKNLGPTALCGLGSSLDETSSSRSLILPGIENVPFINTDSREARAGSKAFSMQFGTRPTVESMIRPPMEAALGETAVVVCGGLSITAQSRTFVAALSNERAVHKGSGAQGVFLFTETYGW